MPITGTMSFPVPIDEKERLAALRELSILDTVPEQLYDDVVALAAAICAMPIALVNFVDAERQWGKALVGLQSSEAPREASFCATTIVQDDGVLVVHDTLADPQWATNPQVLGDPHLRSYAGASIISAEGHALGTVCVADRLPRRIDDAAVQALRILARQTAAHLEMRTRTGQLARANHELQRMAVEDGLTGLANRTLLLESLRRALRQRVRSGRLLGLLFCDLDNLKSINDRLGHEAGDEILRVVARRLAEAARASDLVARFAGDEFVVMCPDLSAEQDLEVIAKRLSRAVSQPVVLHGIERTPRLSIGLAVAHEADDVEDILRRADEAMYGVKRGRRASAPMTAAVTSA